MELEVGSHEGKVRIARIDGSSFVSVANGIDLNWLPAPTGCHPPIALPRSIELFD